MGDEIETIQLSLLKYDVSECCGCCFQYTYWCATVVPDLTSHTISMEEMEEEGGRLVEVRLLEAQVDKFTAMALTKRRTSRNGSNSHQ